MMEKNADFFMQHVQNVCNSLPRRPIRFFQNRIYRFKRKWGLKSKGFEVESLTISQLAASKLEGPAPAPTFSST